MLIAFNFNGKIGPKEQIKKLILKYTGIRIKYLLFAEAIENVIFYIFFLHGVKYRIVSVLPSQPFFLDEVGNKVKDGIGPYHEGDTLVLSCLVIGGKSVFFHFPCLQDQTVP